jgi:hypothetical protein
MTLRLPASPARAPLEAYAAQFAEQVAYALRQAEAGTAVAEVCRKLGISEETFYRCVALKRLS